MRRCWGLSGLLSRILRLLVCRFRRCLCRFLLGRCLFACVRSDCSLCCILSCLVWICRRVFGYRKRFCWIRLRWLRRLILLFMVRLILRLSSRCRLMMVWCGLNLFVRVLILWILRVLWRSRRFRVRRFWVLVGLLVRVVLRMVGCRLVLMGRLGVRFLSVLLVMVRLCWREAWAVCRSLCLR